MATPTPGSASKRPGGGGGGGGVSTPSHLNHSSPAPRSVPSPNAARHHPAAGKTPVNHPTTGSSHGSKTVSSTPMVHNLSQSGTSASPGVNALGTPGLGGLGIEGITPGALHNISTPLAFAMSRTDAELRMAHNVGKRNEDEERRVKVRKVLKNIGRPKGRVSEDGIARLARRVGLVSDIDDEKLTPEERDRKVGNRSFSVAGDSVIVTVDLKDQIPQSVEVNGDAPEPEKAARVLLRDLQEPGDLALTANLDRFAQNLSYLARMDRLKKETDTDCFAAVGGIYRSLQRLYEQEMQASTQQAGVAKAEVNTMCKRSGRPIMHDRQRLGLRLDYWQQNRFPGADNTSHESEMVLDLPDDAQAEDNSKSLWTLLVEAVKCNAATMPYVPLRVSDQWLPDPIKLPSEDSHESVKWLEPTDDHEGLSKPCFLATLHPPVVLPYGAADAILKSFGVQNVPDMQSIPSYLSLSLATASGSRKSNFSSASNGLGSLTSTQEVVSVRDGSPTVVQHRYTLENSKPDFGFLLHELPFSHPKQLIELMPTLRQWAGFGVLLSQSLDGEPSLQNGGREQKPPPRNQPTNLDSIEQAIPEPEEKSLIVNMALATTPQPTLNVTFRRSSQPPSIANLNVHVLRNADVEVEVQDGLEFDDDEARANAEAKMAKALDVCWDLGVWIEWVRGEFS